MDKRKPVMQNSGCRGAHGEERPWSRSPGVHSTRRLETPWGPGEDEQRRFLTPRASAPRPEGLGVSLGLDLNPPQGRSPRGPWPAHAVDVQISVSDSPCKPAVFATCFGAVSKTYFICKNIS